MCGSRVLPWNPSNGASLAQTEGRVPRDACALSDRPDTISYNEIGAGLDADFHARELRQTLFYS
jgi:hypothetical protein